MTLDEAIKHCEEKAEELREQPFKEKMDIEDVASCEECAEEHEQLAEWLKDYKRLLEERSHGEWIKIRPFLHKCSVCGRTLKDVFDDDLMSNYPFCHCGADMRKGGAE